MGIARFSVARPVAVTMRIAALVLLGAVCLLRIPLDLLPKVSIPTLGVSISWPNVGPEEMETQVTRPLEQAVSSANNLYEVSSSSTLGSSMVRVQFNWGTDIDIAAVDVLQLVQRAKRSLPNDPTLSEPTVFKFDPNSLPILEYAVSGISDPIKLRTLLDNEVGPIVESADGVAAATVTGGVQRAIIVNVDPNKMLGHNVTLSQIEKRIGQENINQPAGIAKQGKTEYTIRAVGYFTSVPEIAKMPIGVFNGAPVTLGMVADVRDSHQEIRQATRLNGQDAAGLIITKQSDANTVATAQAVREKVQEVERQYPQLKFSVAYDQSQYIVDSIHDLTDTAIIGGILAIVILLFFLRSIHSTLVVALSIPISIVSTFSLIYFCGYTLNTISLSGLALATGLIVDDAVVVLENIFRHIERDKKRAAEAAVTGTGEILSAVVASTLTVIIVFIPLFLIKGQAGQTFGQFAMVVIFSLAVSLLDASTVVPMLASRLIQEREVEEEAHPELRKEHGVKPTPIVRAFDWFGMRFNALDQAYRRGLEWAIHHRAKVLVAVVVVTGASLVLMPFIGTELMPQTDSGNFNVNVKLPVGTAYEVTDAKMRQIESILTSNPDVATVFSASGSNLNVRGASSRPIGYQGGAMVKLKDDRKHSTSEVIQSLQRKFAAIPGIRALATPFDLVTQVLTGGPTNMEVDVFSQNQQILASKAREVMDAMRNIPGLESVDLGVQDASPELQWNVDRLKARELGLSFDDIAQALSTTTSGDLTTYYQENGFQYPIYVQFPESERRTLSELERLPIAPANGTSGAPIFLSQVAIPVFRLGPNEITRLNRRRYIAVVGRINGISESDVQADITKALAGISFPEGATWDFGDAQRRRGEEFSGLGLAIFLAIALIYIVLASQFESFVYPLIVLCSVPLCVIGVILALFLTGRAFGLTAFIGVLMLIGIVVKNGILLVDYTNQLRGRGMQRDPALLTAAPTRLRPILMTSSAAILGMFPLALGIGRGSETQAPLATAVVGGLLTSTCLTLFVVPVVYTFFDDLAGRFRKSPSEVSEATKPAETQSEVGFRRAAGK